MHLSQDTYNQIASLLQKDAKQFRKQKLMESISFKQMPDKISITMDNMGIGKLVSVGGELVFSSQSSLGEQFNGVKYHSVDECKEALVSYMMGEKNESVTLAEDVEELEEGAITVDQLKVGKVYTLEDEDGTKFKAKILDISDAPKQGGRLTGQKVWEVKYEYVDNSYAKKGGKDVFIVARNEKVFHEAVEELEEKYNDDEHVIMQLRKAQDVGGKLDIKFHSGPTGRLTPEQIKQILGVYDKLTPEGKRRMRVMMKTHKSTLDMLKEDVYHDTMDELDESSSIAAAVKKRKGVHQAVIKKAKTWMKRTGRDAKAAIKEFDLYPSDENALNEEMDEIDESTFADMRDFELASFYKKMKGIKGLEKVVKAIVDELKKRNKKTDIIAKMLEEIELEESTGTPEQIKKEYADLKKLPIKEIERIYMSSHRVSYTQGAGKETLISSILRSRHGDKKVAAAFGLKEDQELDETAYEKDMDPKKKVTVQGVKGMKSRPFKKTFPNMAAYEKWADSAAAEDVDVSRVFQEEAEELDESNTTPFFIDPKTKKALPPKDEIAALEDYIKSSSRQSGSGSDQKLYVAKQRLQYLSARVVREEADKDEDEAEVDDKKGKKKGKKKDGEELDMDPKMSESFKDMLSKVLDEAKIKKHDTVHAKSINVTGMVYEIKGSKAQIRTPTKMVTVDVKDLEVVEMDEAKSGYKIYHPTYSAAVAEALAVVKKAGHTVDEDDFFNKITSGPRKPSSGKTNSASVALEGTKKVLHMQVYNTGKSFELNCYIQ